MTLVQYGLNQYALLTKVAKCPSVVSSSHIYGDLKGNHKDNNN